MFPSGNCEKSPSKVLKNKTATDIIEFGRFLILKHIWKTQIYISYIAKCFTTLSQAGTIKNYAYLEVEHGVTKLYVRPLLSLSKVSAPSSGRKMSHYCLSLRKFYMLAIIFDL